VGEREHEPFQSTFNGFLNVAFLGSRVTPDAGLLLVRELDERLGLATLIAEHLSDSRQGLNTQFSLAEVRTHENESLAWTIAELLVRPPGRPSRKPLVRYKSLQYQAGRRKARRRRVGRGCRVTGSGRTKSACS
jgi:hypothetical protein